MPAPTRFCRTFTGKKRAFFKKIRKHFNFLYLSLNNIRLSSLNKSTSPASQEIQIHHPSIAQAKTGKFYSNFPTWFLAEVVDPEPRAELLPPPVEPKGRAAEQTEQNRPENHRPVIFVHFSHFFPTRHNNRKDDSLRSRREHCSPSAFPISVRILSSIFFFCLLCAGRRAVSIFSSSFLSSGTQSEQHTRDTFCSLLLWHKGIWGHSRKKGLKSSSSRSLWISRITPLEKKTFLLSRRTLSSQLLSLLLLLLLLPRYGRTRRVCTVLLPLLRSVHSCSRRSLWGRRDEEVKEEGEEEEGGVVWVSLGWTANRRPPPPFLFFLP